MNSLSTANPDGFFSVNLGSHCPAIKFLINHIEYTHDSDYMLWSETAEQDDSNVQPDACTGATLFLMADDGAYFGELDYDSIFFKILDLGDDLALLVGLDPSIQGVCLELSPDQASLSSQTLNNASTSDPCAINDCVVDVLFGFTTQAQDYIVNTLNLSVAGYVDSKVAYFNYVEKRSSHNGSYAQIRRSDLVLVPNLEGEDFEEIDDFLLDGFRASVQEFDYDLAHLICTTRPTSASQSTVGAAYIGPNGDGDPAAQDRNVGFSMTGVSPNEKITAHEIAHNFGARHHNAPAGIANRGKRFEYRTWFLGRKKVGGTLMYAYLEPIMKDNFSNPYISFFSTSTGDLGTRFNHYYIDQNKCTIAQYAGSAYTTVLIKGETYICSYGSTVLSACEPPGSNFSYQWHSSLNGISWNYLGSGNTQSIFANVPAGSVMKVRLTVNTGSSTYTRYHDLFVSTSTNGLPCTKSFRSVADTTAGVATRMHSPNWSVDVFPNPVDQSIVKLKFDHLPSESFDVEVWDVHSKLVSRDANVMINTDEWLMNWDNIPTGLYLIKVKYKGNTKTFKTIRYE